VYQKQCNRISKGLQQLPHVLSQFVQQATINKVKEILKITGASFAKNIYSNMWELLSYDKVHIISEGTLVHRLEFPLEFPMEYIALYHFYILEVIIGGNQELVLFPLEFSMEYLHSKMG